MELINVEKVDKELFREVVRRIVSAVDLLENGNSLPKFTIHYAVY